MIDQRNVVRIQLAIASILAWGLFYLGAGVAGFPEPGNATSSILMQSNWWLHLAILGITLALSLAATTLITLRIRFDAPIYCSCLGMTAWSVRGGTIRDTLFAASSSGVYLLMILEVAVLFALLGGAWLVMRRLFGSQLVADEQTSAIRSETGSQRAVAVGAMVLALLIGMTLFSRSPEKPQVILALLVAAILAAVTASRVSPTRPSIWFWMPVGIVAIAGYLNAYFQPGGWEIGQVRSYLWTLAQPMPIDFASIGVAGAILGYWWMLKPRDSEAPAGASTAPAAPAAHS